MAITDEAQAIIQPLSGSWFHQLPLSVSMLRLDRVHPVISGNKYYKLKYNLQAAKQQACTHVLTFGGSYSNHLVAAAAMAALQGVPSIGIVRGFHAAQQETATLQQCRAYGMELHFVSREEYARKQEPEYLQQLASRFPGVFIVPEGGSNESGRKGAGDIAALIPAGTTHVCIPVGTGTTLAGLREALPAAVFITGFVPMKGGAYLMPELSALLSPAANAKWEITDKYHFGGFGKITPELSSFMQDFESNCAIPLDRVYTAKMMYGVRDMLHQGLFPAGANIVCIHTGGLQGNG